MTNPGAERAKITQVPSHVSPAVVWDYDFQNDPLFATDPHQAMMKLTAGAPDIFYVPRYGGYWVCKRFEDIREFSRNTDLFSNYPAAIPPLVGRPRKMAPIEIDPPLLQRYRNVLGPLFAPSAVRAMETTVRRLAADLLDKFAANGTVELIEEFCIPLPVNMFLLLIGVPLEKSAWLRSQHAKMHHGNDDDVRRQGGMEVGAFLAETFKSRQQNPGADILSRLVTATPEGGPYSFEELVDIGFTLFTAGLDTVTNTLGLAWKYLGEHPAKQREIVANQALISDAADELLRYTAIISSTRVATCDFEYKNICMKKGDQVLLPLGLANHDPDAFSDPGSVRFDRKVNQHLTFGSGAHRCLGSHLARLEIMMALEEWFKRIPLFRIDEDKPLITHGGHAQGVSCLHLTWERQ